MSSFEKRQIESPDSNSKDQKELEALEVLVERLNLKEQYLDQVKVLYQSGILENLAPTPDRPTPEMGIIGIDGQEYILPDYEDLLERLKDPETRELVKNKAEQGFVKLQITPFALPLSVLIDRYKTILLKIHKETGLKTTDGSTLELDENNPLFVWEDLVQSDNPSTSKDKQIEYGVSNYAGKTKEERGGKYKNELLKENPDNGWQISLIEDLPDLPKEGKGLTITNRKQLEANKTPTDYLKLLQTQEQYQGESGQTPEDALTTWLTYLQEKQTVIDDWQGQGKANWLAGTFVSGNVLVFNWYRYNRRPSLSRDSSDARDSDSGFRSAVRF